MCEDHMSFDGSPDYDDTDETGQQYYRFPYILALVRFICRGIGDADQQDIAQRAWIAFLPKLESGVIDNPHAYLVQTIRSKFADYLRWRDAHLLSEPTPTGEDGSDREVPGISSERLISPAERLEENLLVAEFYDELAAGIEKLPRCQQRAMAAFTLDKALNPFPLFLALKAHNIDESQMRWPEDKKEKRVLQASLHAAREALANHFHIDLSQYKPRKRRPRHPTSHDDQP